jgi:ABC-type bacteriocin/lantibiotic exporter with double-glycine peptidase domain
LVKPIDEVYRFMDETASSVIKAKILLEVSASSSDEIFDIQSTEKTINNNDIRIENVVVTNPEKERPIAWYDNIVIPCDRKVALQGGNGCGKTSLIRSLNRYYPHIQGRITMFGKEQETYSQRELADVLFYTPQSSFFIVGTVRENLLYGIERPVSDEELVSALRSVFLTGYDHKYTVIQRDPMKALSSMINEKADELSGGMKQRLSLARAFLRRPKVFVFDEITANLDEIVTNDVLTNIEEYARKVNAGIIYISHDQKVVDRCDKVILLKNKLQKNTEDKEVA